MSAPAPVRLTTILIYAVLLVNVAFIIGALIWLEWDSHRWRPGSGGKVGRA